MKNTILSFSDIKAAYAALAQDIRDNIGINQTIVLDSDILSQEISSAFNDIEIKYDPNRKKIIFRRYSPKKSKYVPANNLPTDTISILADIETIKAIRTLIIEQYNNACEYKKSFFYRIQDIIRGDLR